MNLTIFIVKVKKIQINLPKRIKRQRFFEMNRCWPEVKPFISKIYIAYVTCRGILRN